MHFLENSMFVLNAYFCRELRFVAILRSKLRFLLRNTGVDSDFTQNFWGKNWWLEPLLFTYMSACAPKRNKAWKAFFPSKRHRAMFSTEFPFWFLWGRRSYVPPPILQLFLWEATTTFSFSHFPGTSSYKEFPKFLLCYESTRNSRVVVHSLH